MFALWQMRSRPAGFDQNVESLLNACQESAAAGAMGLVAPAFCLSGYAAPHLRKRADFLLQQEKTLEILRTQLPKDFILALACFSPQGDHRLVVLGAQVDQNGIFHHAGLCVKCVFFDELKNQRTEISAQEENIDLLIVLDSTLYTSQACPGRDVHIGQWAAICPVLYVNAAGTQDGLIFSGQSQLIPQGGEFEYQADFFSKLILVKPFSPVTEKEKPPKTAQEEYWLQALTVGIRDFMHDAGFSRVHLGLSGGIDSALVATIATQALGSENVTGILMPSRYSSQGSIKDALELAKNLQMRTLTIGIEEMHAKAHDVLGAHFPIEGLSDENLQARLRGLFLMTYSNAHQSLLLNTGNKSELAVGYSTLYGDSCGVLAVIGDLWKTQVYRLCKYINNKAGVEIIPQNILLKAPSAELHPDQKDQDSLPDYQVLDEVLGRYLEDNFSLQDLLFEGYDEAVVNKLIKLFHQSAYKRKQAAGVLRLSKTAFGFENLNIE